MMRSFKIWLAAGVSASALETMLTVIPRQVGWSPYDHELALGAALSGSAGAISWSLGFLAHLFLGGLFGVVYGWLLKKAEWSGVFGGLVFGLIHWFGAGLLVAAEIPGADFVTAAGPSVVDPLWIHFGYATFCLVFVSYVLFGGLVGWASKRYQT